MSSQTSIEWTDRSWNPVTGCDKVSPGCAHCYAEGVAARFWVKQYPAVAICTQSDLDTTCTFHRPRQFTDVMTHEDRLLEPLSWRKPQRIFVNSMSDLFHEDVPFEFIAAVFAVMAYSARHTFQVLTKRPARALEFMKWVNAPEGADTVREVYGLKAGQVLTLHRMNRVDHGIVQRVHESTWDGLDLDACLHNDGVWPPGNVWLGVSVENQHFADERIPLLLQTLAAVRFISAEPLLGPLNLNVLNLGDHRTAYGLHRIGHNALTGWENQWTVGVSRETPRVSRGGQGRLDWVIVGGESGAGARRCSAQWVRGIVRQCRSAGVPVFVKQLGANVIDRNDAGFDGCDKGSWPVEIEERDGVEFDINGFREEFQGADCRVRLRDRKGGDPDEWPEDLRVRQFPEARV